MLTMRCIFLFQPISLGIFRSDYLIDKSDGLNRCSDYFGEVTPKPANGSISIKQVEMNTISLGGITFSCFVPKMHRYSSEGGVRPARIQILSNSATIFSYYFSSRYCWFSLMFGRKQNKICHRKKLIHLWRIGLKFRRADSSLFRHTQYSNFWLLKKLWCCVGETECNMKIWFYQTSG